MLLSILLWFLCSVSAVQITTITQSPSFTHSQSQYCGDCFLTFRQTVTVQATATVLVITNANGTTTSTFENSATSSDSLDPVNIEASFYLLSYGVLSIGNSSIKCIPKRSTLDGVMTFATTLKDNAFSWDVVTMVPSPAFSSVIASIFIGQAVPTDCSAELPNGLEFSNYPVLPPFVQRPAIDLTSTATTTISINNMPASAKGTTTTPAPHITAGPEAGSATPVIPGPTSHMESSSVSSSTSTIIDLVAVKSATVSLATSSNSPRISLLSIVSPSVTEGSATPGTPISSQGLVIIYSGTTLTLDASEVAAVVAESIILPTGITAADLTTTISGSVYQIYTASNGNILPAISSMTAQNTFTISSGNVPLTISSATTQSIPTTLVQTGAATWHKSSRWRSSAVVFSILVLANW